MIKVLVVGQTPPPWGGQTLMIDRLLRGPVPGVRCYHVRMAFSNSMADVGRAKLGKLWELFSVIVRIHYHRIVHGTRILYYPPSGPDKLPMLRDLVILLSTRWLFAKTVFHFHAGGVSELYPRLPGWLRPVFRWAYYRVDAAIRLSRLAPNDPGRLQARHAYVVPCGIDDLADEIDGPLPPRRAADAARILFVGVFLESKGVLDLLHAVGKLVERGVELKLEMMGEFPSGEMERHFWQLAQRLDVSSRVRTLGVLTGSKKAEAFARADMFCFPTFFESETFGLVLVEAMSMRLPVVATRWRGIPSIVEEGQTGFLVDVHDTDALADRLAALARDPELREHMGRAARERFESEYRLEQFLNRMARMFHEVAGVECGLPRERPFDEASEVPGGVAAQEQLVAESAAECASHEEGCTN